jgi:hypothetical protein
MTAIVTTIWVLLVLVILILMLIGSVCSLFFVVRILRGL